jgi:hypothetical protein
VPLAQSVLLVQLVQQVQLVQVVLTAQMVLQVQLDLQVLRVQLDHKEFKASRVMSALLDQSVLLAPLVQLDRKE